MAQALQPAFRNSCPPANLPFLRGTPDESSRKTVTPVEFTPIVRDRRLCGLVGAARGSADKEKRGLGAPNLLGGALWREVHATEEGFILCRTRGLAIAKCQDKLRLVSEDQRWNSTE